MRLALITLMLLLGNALGDDILRRAFADRELKRNVQPVIGMERFNTTP